MLGGNIGQPLIEHLTELTPAHRVVDELSELQLPTLSRGTTVAVYTNVTADHLDRHGTLEAYRRGQEAARGDGRPTGHSWSTPRTRSSRPTRQSRVRTVTYRRSAPVRVGWASSTAGSSRTPSRHWPAGRGRLGRTGRGRPDHAGGRARDPGRPQRLERHGRDRHGLLFGLEPELIRAAASAFTGVEHRLEPVATIDGVRFINDSQGTQPDAVWPPPCLRRADRAHRRRPGQGHRPVRARTGRRRASGRGRAHRRERAGPGVRVPGRRSCPDRARAGPRDRCRAAPMRSPAKPEPCPGPSSPRCS